MTASAGLEYLAWPPALHTLAQAQCGVVTRRQLDALGIGVEQVRANVAARRWQTFGRRGVVLQNSPLSNEQRLWVATLMLDQPVALAAWTAAQAAGLAGFEVADVHIVVDRACDARLPRWVRVHNSRRFTADDIGPGALPRVRTARALVDAAAWSSGPRRACALLCAGVQQRLVRTDDLGAELEIAGKIRYHRLLRSMVGDIGGGGHTLTELDLAGLARRAGLGLPRRQVLRREPGGKARYVDAEFDLPDGSTFLVEIDGAVHLKTLSWWDDLDRQNYLVIGGDRLLLFDSVSVRIDQDRVVEQLDLMRRAHLPS